MNTRNDVCMGCQLSNFLVSELSHILPIGPELDLNYMMMVFKMNEKNDMYHKLSTVILYLWHRGIEWEKLGCHRSFADLLFCEHLIITRHEDTLVEPYSDDDKTYIIGARRM